MHKQQFDQFIDYYKNCICSQLVSVDMVDHLYQQFGREFIFDLPIEYVYGLPLVCGIIWCHNTSDVALYHDGVPLFYILGCQLSLDEWLPRSSLSPEEQLVFKLKYG